MREDAALQIVVQFAFHIGGQACGIGIGVERGEKGLQMVGERLDRARSGSDRVVRRWQQQVPYVHPTYNIEVRDVTGRVIDYTIHMCSI